MDLGTYQRIDGRPSVRFERAYRKPIDEVWPAVTTPDRLGRWFPSRVQYDARVGGVIRFSGDPNVPDSTGEVLEFDPLQLLAFSWGPNQVRFELTELDDSRTRFVLIDFLSAENEAARNAAGWEQCLEALDGALDSTPADDANETKSTPASWRDRYDRYVAAGLPSGAPFPE